MINFLDYLAGKAFQYYRFLYKNNPQAYTSAECFRRIEIKAKYEEVLDIIDSLPNKDEIVVREKFDELKKNY